MHQNSTTLVYEIAAIMCTNTTKLVHSWPVAGPLCHSCTNFVVLVHTLATILNTCVADPNSQYQ